MIAVSAIVAGYAVLLAHWGWPAAIVAAIHVGVMLAALRR